MRAKRTTVGALVMSGLWTLACMGGEPPPEPEPLPVPEVAPEPEEPVLPSIRLQAYVVTSNQRYGDRAVDSDPGSSWEPIGDARGEGILLRLEKPKALSALEIDACASGAPYDVELYVNGRERGVTTVDGSASVKLPGKGVRSLFLKMKSKEACVAELRVVDDAGPNELMPPRRIGARIETSSTLQPPAAYHPTYLFDGRTHFAWVEGAEGVGEGESISLTFPENQLISGLEIWNGYQRSPDHFEKNGRIKLIELEASGRRTMLDLDDSKMGAQIEKFDPPLNTRYLTLTMAQVTKGSKYEDTVVSELRFYDRKGAFTIAPLTPPELDRRLRDKVKGGSLEPIVDTFFQQACGSPRELKLRSDHSFVRYERYEDDSGSHTEVFDGAWVPKKKGTVKLYGRRHVATKEWQPYGGPAEEESTRVSGGTLAFRQLADLSVDEVGKVVQEMKRAGAEERVACLLDDRGRLDEAKLAEVVGKNAILVEGKAITDLMLP